MQITLLLAHGLDLGQFIAIAGLQIVAIPMGIAAIVVGLKYRRTKNESQRKRARKFAFAALGVVAASYGYMCLDQFLGYQRKLIDYLLIPLGTFMTLFILIGPAIGTALLAIHLTRLIRNGSELTCRRCGYVLKGTFGPRCPECFTLFDELKSRPDDLV